MKLFFILILLRLLYIIEWYMRHMDTLSIEEQNTVISIRDDMIKTFIANGYLPC